MLVRWLIFPMSDSLEDNLRRILQEVVCAELQETLAPLLAQFDNAEGRGHGPTGKQVFLMPEEAAAFARVQPTTVRAWVSRGELPGHYAGRHLRIRRDELVEYMRRGRKASAAHHDSQRINEILGEEP